MLHKAGKKRHHKRNADEANMPRFGERHCQRWQNRCQKEEPCERQEEQKEQAFKYQNVLDVLTKELGIDQQKAKEALLKHEGDFDLACSTASKDLPVKESKEQPQKECEKQRNKKWRKKCHDKDQSNAEENCSPWGRPHHGHRQGHGHGKVHFGIDIGRASCMEIE